MSSSALAAGARDRATTGRVLDRLGRLGRAGLVSLLPVLTGLYVAAATFPGGRLIPWQPVMVDLDVYRQAGQALLDGHDFYALPGQLPFLYPPFAALLAVPLAWLPPAVVQIGWTVVGVLLVLAVLHRFGLHGWPLSLLGTAVVCFVGPVVETLAFGQLGIILVALVVLDLVPGPRALGGRRLLPEGVLTALAAAVKLTPAILVLYLLAVRRWRPALVAIGTGLAVTLATAVLVPGPSVQFWGRLAHGDTGLGHSLIYYTNQSVLADVVRALGLGGRVAAVGLALSAAVAVLGVLAAAAWHRRGEVALAVTVCGIAGLLASPVSWWHHFVWILPMALCLADRTREATRPAAPPGSALPGWFRALGWLFVGWVLLAPFRRLPNGADLELTWTWWQNALATVTAVLGTAWLIGALVGARGTVSLADQPEAVPHATARGRRLPSSAPASHRAATDR